MVATVCTSQRQVWRVRQVFPHAELAAVHLSLSAGLFLPPRPLPRELICGGSLSLYLLLGPPCRQGGLGQIIQCSVLSSSTIPGVVHSLARSAHRSASCL